MPRGLICILILSLTLFLVSEGYARGFAKGIRRSLASSASTKLQLGEGSIVDGDSSVENKDEDLDVYGKLRKELKGTNLFLVGMMGSGKSSIGNKLGHRMGYRYIDTDEVAEFMIEMPIADFFAQEGGEKEFRQVEHKVLLELAQYTRTVISTGGGIVESNENWGVLHHGIVVFLDAAPEDIYARLSADPEEIKRRPLLQQGEPLEQLVQIRERRLDLYNQADVKVPITKGMTLEEVEELVAVSILEAIKKNPPQWSTWKTNKEAEIYMNTNSKFDGGDGNVLQ